MSKLKFLLLWLPMAASIAAAEPPASFEEHSPTAGVVVLNLKSWSVLAAAGIKSGDELVAWNRFSPDRRELVSQGEFQSIFDYYELLTNETPRGPISLKVRRSDSLLELPIETGEWGAEMRPVLTDDLLQLYLDGRTGTPQCALSGPWFELGTAAADRKLPAESAWIFLRIAASCQDDKETLEDALRLAIRSGREIENGKFYSALLREGAVHLRAAGEHEAARELLLEARDWCEENRPSNLCYEKALVLLGELEYGTGNSEAALSPYRKAAERYHAVWSSSLQSADVSLKLGAVLDNLGFLLAAQAELSQALEINKKRTQISPLLPQSMLNLGKVKFHLGDVGEARRLIEGSLEIYKKIAPRDRMVATILINLSLVQKEEGDYEGAMASLENAMHINRLSGDEWRLANSLNDLGVLLIEMGDDRAEVLHEEALRLRLKTVPGTMSVAQSLANIGTVNLKKGRTAAAEKYYLEALEIARNKAPRGPEVANILNSLGATALSRGALEEAFEKFKESYDHSIAISPVKPLAATASENLAEMYLSRGDFEMARELAHRALEIRLNYGRGSFEQATSSYILAKALAGMGRFAEAKQVAREAYAHCVAQIGKLSSQGFLRAQFRRAMRPALALYVQLVAEESPETAFGALEEFRANEFFALLDAKERMDDDLSFRADWLQDPQFSSFRYLGPPWLARTSSGLQEYFSSFDRFINDKGGYRLTPPSSSRRNLKEIQGSLQMGELILSYFVVGEYSCIFAITRSDLNYFKMPAETIVRAQVESVLQILMDGSVSSSLAASRRAVLDRKLSELAESVVGPVLDEIASARRVQFVLDGPLHYIPIAALRPVVEGNARYFAEWKPFSVILSSAALPYFVGLREREANFGIQLLAFGSSGCRVVGMCDEFLDLNGTAVKKRLQTRLGSKWGSLPGVEREVAGIAALFPEGSALLLMGAQATEAHAYEHGGHARILHFAGHAFVDDAVPLSSGLVLAAESEGGRAGVGLLQADEVFRSIGLQADLVVLSACDSATGPDGSGEGLISLTRAFQTSGARTVLASLWSVEDGTTADLMINFYRHWLSGKPKADALQAAQLDFIRSSTFLPGTGVPLLDVDESSPYFWAAFQLYGDWR